MTTHIDEAGVLACQDMWDVDGDFDFEVHPYDSRPSIGHSGRGVWFCQRHDDGIRKISYATSARRSKSVPIDR